MVQQQTPLDEQTQRDIYKKSSKRKSKKKVLQIQLPDKAQPQSSQPELQLHEQKQIDALTSQTSTTNCAKPQRHEIIDKHIVTHSVDAATTHTSSSDASTASCDSDSEEAVTEKLSSMCHHCLRPQIELQLRHLRPHQRRQWNRLLQQHCSKRRTSKSRKEVSWSGAHGDGENGSGRRNGHGDDGGSNAGAVNVGLQRYGAGDYMLPTNSYSSGVHWSRRDVSAAVRYRCPQVGPKSAPYHFHHPQQLHNAYQLQLLLQQCEYVPPSYYQQQQQQQQPYYEQHAALQNNKMDYNTTITTATSTTTTAITATTINIECESHMQLQKQHDRNVRLQLNQNLYAATNIQTATSSGCSENCCTSNASSVAASALTAPAGTVVALQPQPTAHHHDRTTRGTVSDSELQLQQQLPTSESPSLVKVRAWYTVAKQGVSC